MGAQKFFQALPLKLLEHDLTSLTFAQDSRSYLLPLMNHHLSQAGQGGDLAFFV
jgi:hypothetical protein